MHSFWYEPAVKSENINEKTKKSFEKYVSNVVQHKFIRNSSCELAHSTTKAETEFGEAEARGGGGASGGGASGGDASGGGASDGGASGGASTVLFHISCEGHTKYTVIFLDLPFCSNGIFRLVIFFFQYHDL